MFVLQSLPVSIKSKDKYNVFTDILPTEREEKITESGSNSSVEVQNSI